MDTTQLLKGVLDVAVLAVVDDEDGYGYDVVRRLRAGGLEGVGDASVYGTLRRLYASGALTSYVVPSEAGPHRKYYGITPAGRTLLGEQRDAWASFSASVSALLGLQAPASHGERVREVVGHPRGRELVADDQQREHPLPNAERPGGAREDAGRRP